MAILTEEEKARIIAEEIYRKEVQERLSEKKKGGKIIEFLNSTFGIWVLTSIVLASFTFLFNDYTQYAKEKTERKARINKLDLEIENRISQFWGLYRDLVETRDTLYTILDTATYTKNLHRNWEAFKLPTEVTVIKSMYKDMDGRPTVSLMAELADLIRQENNLEDAEIRKVYTPEMLSDTSKLHLGRKEKAYKEVARIRGAVFSIASNDIFWDKPNPSLKEVYAIFSKHIILNRWDDLFPFTECLYC